jgi:hypothetical protein
MLENLDKGEAGKELGLMYKDKQDKQYLIQRIETLYYISS